MDKETEDLEQERIRARQAHELLHSDLFVGAMRHIEEGLKAQRQKVPMRETEMHTRLILAEQLWQQFVDYFRFIEQTGELADFEIHRQETLRERFAAMLRGNPRETV